MIAVKLSTVLYLIHGDHYVRHPEFVQSMKTKDGKVDKTKLNNAVRAYGSSGMYCNRHIPTMTAGEFLFAMQESRPIQKFTLSRDQEQLYLRLENIYSQEVEEGVTGDQLWQGLSRLGLTLPGVRLTVNYANRMIYGDITGPEGSSEGKRPATFEDLITSWLGS